MTLFAIALLIAAIILAVWAGKKGNKVLMIVGILAAISCLFMLACVGLLLSAID